MVFLVILAVATVCRAASASQPVRTFFQDGRFIDEVIIDGRPPDNYRAPAVIVPSTDVSAGIVTLPNVPAFNWCYGCSATSAAMLMGYYDNNGYPNMYTGPANGGVCPMTNAIWGYGQCPLSATRQGYDGRNILGHVDDYWRSSGNCNADPYVGAWTEHTHGDCTGDYMGTNQSKYSNCDGATTFYFYTDGSPLYDYGGSEPSRRDGCRGMKLFVQSRGYSVSTNFSQYIYGYNGITRGFTFQDFQAEIDQGRPVLIQVTGHTMLGYGYDSATQTIYIHDTWDHNHHSMTWGGSYSGMAHYGVTVLRLSCSGAGPTITAQPVGGTRCVGESMWFNVTATGATTYQWRKNGTDIAGATMPNFTLTSVQPADAGDYDCVVGSLCGSTTSAIATLVVNSPPAITSGPSDRSVFAGDTATFSITATGSGLLYQWQVSSDGGSSFTDVTEGVGATTPSYTTGETTPADNGKKFRCVVSGPCPPSVVSAAATLTVDTAVVLLSEGFESAVPPEGRTMQYVTGEAPWEQHAGDLSGGSAAEGACNAWLYSSSSANHKTYLITPPIRFSDCGAGAVLTFWHKQAGTTRQDTLDVCYKTSESGNWTLRAMFPSNVPEWTKRIVMLPNLSSTYYIGFLGNAKGGNGVCIDNVVVLQGCCAPSILTQPSPVTTCVGTTASFSVTAQDLDLTYQWRKNGIDIEGATASEFTISAASHSDTGGYDCAITNSCGSVTSDVAVLVVGTPPKITTHPSETETWAGGDATFAVAAEGLEPLSYQWMRNGTPIPGATGAAYTVTNADLSDAAEYCCVVSNQCGSATSDGALLYVIAPAPDISTVKLIRDGHPVAIVGKPVTYASTDYLYVEETNRSAGIRIEHPGHGLTAGTCAYAVGPMRTSPDGERYIAATSVVGKDTGSVEPVLISSSALCGADWHYDSRTGKGQRGATGAHGLNNVGLLVKTWGSYTRTGSTSFTLSDGIGLPIVCSVEPGFLLSASWQRAVVVGISSILKIDESTWRPHLLVREIQPY